SAASERFQGVIAPGSEHHPGPASGPAEQQVPKRRSSLFDDLANAGAGVRPAVVDDDDVTAPQCLVRDHRHHIRHFGEHAIKDSTKFEEYLRKVVPMIERFGGRYLTYPRVLIFPEAMRVYPWDLQPKSTMTNANVEQVATGGGSHAELSLLIEAPGAIASHPVQASAHWPRGHA